MVIPIHDKNPVRRTPYITYAIIAINTAVFLIGPAAAPPTSPTPAQACAQQRYFLEYGAIPHELLSNHQLAAAQLPRMLVSTNVGQQLCVFGALPHKIPALSVLTAMFVHAGWLHLIGNMLFLYVFGNNVEDRFGRLHFTVFYLAGGYLATYAFAWLNPNADTPLVGASGAIAAVLGAYLFLYPRAKVTSLVPFLLFLPLRFPAWLVLGSWFVLQLPPVQRLIGVPTDSTVAYVAHVAGFLAGFVYTILAVGRGDSGRGALGPPGPRSGRARRSAEPVPHWSPPDPYGAGNPYPPQYPGPPGY
ncbi:MAG TPA: rhomboid family intramembrane serine protease [Actinocrinis sp.]